RRHLAAFPPGAIAARPFRYNHARPTVAQAFRHANGRAGCPEGLRYVGGAGSPEGLRYVDGAGSPEGLRYGYREAPITRSDYVRSGSLRSGRTGLRGAWTRDTAAIRRAAGRRRGDAAPESGERGGRHRV